nr:uncharacterized protein LOC113823197 isoform X2 [Penaeus vannamei]
MRCSGTSQKRQANEELWENMKSRAKKLYGIEGNRIDGSVHAQHYDVISAKVFDIISKDLNRNIKTRDVNSDPTCGTDGAGCSGGSQAEMCRVREECQETFMDETAEDEDTLGADDTIAFDVVNKTVGLPFPVGNDSLDLGDSRISSVPDVQNARELPSSELENKRPSFSDSQVSLIDHLPNSPERPALCGNRTSDSDERGLAAAARLSHISEGPKLGCDISAGTTTSGAASPLRTRLKFSEEECYTASDAFQKKEHKLLMNVQKAKLQAQEAKLKHLDKQALIDAEKLKQMQMQSLLNAHLLESITQWKEIAVSIQETVDKLKNFYQVGETSAADKNSTKGTSATEKSSDGSVHLKPKENPSSVLESLYEDLAFADVTLTAQGQSVRAHRAVLSAKSLYFKEVLQSNPYQHPIIIMPLDVQFSDLQAIISYIYKGEITLPSENLQSLLKTANALQISDLARADVLGRTANGRDEAPL